MNIQEHVTLEMHNVLSYRGKMSQQEMHLKSLEFEKVLKETGAKKSAPVVTSTFSVEQSPNGPIGPIMDIEILMSLDREITPPAGFTWKSHFLLTNALKITHTGNPAGLENSVNELNQFIVQNSLVPISTGYNVTVKEAKTPMELDQMVIDIYVGISPNKL